MVTTTPGQTARTHPIDAAVSNYSIEVNHAGNASTDRHIRQLRSIPARTIVPAMDPDRNLISLKLAHSNEAQLRSLYRGNCAPCLATAGTPWQHANRGPPGSSRKPRDARQDVSEQCNVDPEIPAVTELPLLLSGSGDGSLSGVRRR